MQWRDRNIYWLARNRSRVERDVLCNIIDSYDKGKLCLPRWPNRRSPKSTTYELLKRRFSQLKMCIRESFDLFYLITAKERN